MDTELIENQVKKLFMNISMPQIYLTVFEMENVSVSNTAVNE